MKLHLLLWLLLLPAISGAGEEPGIDVAASVTRYSDVVPEGLVVTVHDSVDVRRLLATAGMTVSPETQKLAEDPAFRIRVSLQTVPPEGG